MTAPHTGNGTLHPAPQSAPWTDANPSPPPGPGRDARGRFTAHNPGGPGNPFARQTAALRQVLLDTVTSEDLRAIVGRLVEAAKQGDVTAARLILSYTVGKPAPSVDPDTLDLQEWALWQQMPVLAQTLQSLL